jgi:hypothetical protein
MQTNMEEAVLIMGACVCIQTRMQWSFTQASVVELYILPKKCR